MTATRGETVVSAQIGVIRGGVAPVEHVETPAPEGVRLAIQLESPVRDKLLGFVETNRRTSPLEVMAEKAYLGQSLALCGAGPSLADYRLAGVDHVFACNSALPWLIAHGVTVSAAIGMDQSPGLLREWADPPDVPYFIASSCDPALVAHLKAHGRRVVFFHNAVGLPDEFNYYCRTWPPTMMVGEGFSVVSRAIGLAQYLGFRRVDVYGADCAFGPNDVTHANGESAVAAYDNPLIMRGDVDGREWRTRPDMLMDAVHLARRVAASAGRIRLIGDTLPVALIGQDESFLDDVCRRLTPEEASAVTVI